VESKVCSQVPELQNSLLVQPPDREELPHANEAVTSLYGGTCPFSILTLYSRHDACSPRGRRLGVRIPGMTRQNNGVERGTWGLRGADRVDKVGVRFPVRPEFWLQKKRPRKGRFFCFCRFCGCALSPAGQIPGQSHCHFWMRPTPLAIPNIFGTFAHVAAKRRPRVNAISPSRGHRIPANLLVKGIRCKFPVAASIWTLHARHVARTRTRLHATSHYRENAFCQEKFF
jgi:hypothetical protein